MPKCLLNYFPESAPDNVATQERQVSSAKFKTTYLAHISGAPLMFEDTELKCPSEFAELK